MGGGLMQLVAYGAQDIYLTGNPQITFFKVVYRRHTNFSMECIEQTFNGTVAATASTVTATISRNGDLISSMHLDVKFAAGMTGSAGNASTQWTNNTGHAFVKDVEIEIGGQRIDKHYGQFLDIYNELTDHDESEVAGLNKHKAKNAYLLNGVADAGAMDTLRTYVPLKFWFNRNPGLALPLIALQYHEVKVKLSTRGMVGLVNTTGTLAGTAAAPSECKLWVDYIYLDTDERRRFAQQSHEYLIEQLQREESTMSTSQKLNFNHPVKELIWVVQDDTARSENSSATAATIDATQNVTTTTADNNDYFNYNTNITDDSEIVNGQTSYESFATAKLQLNGHDRFAARNASYFRTVQPAQAGHRVPEKHIYNYSFALKPEEHQPSGTCNFSRIDTAKLIFTTGGTLADTTLTVYAVNYNVLRIMSGMGGLAYSN
jgi:hypothetical protein